MDRRSGNRAGPELVPSEGDRVRAHTSEDVLRKLDAEARARVEACAQSPERIDPRLQELEEEWDVERWLEANAAAFAFIGVLLGRRDPRWLGLPAVVLPLLFQHAVQGWCPPLALFRRLGVRTRREIDAEKFALKALRGDFARVDGDPPDQADAALVAVSR